MVAVLIFAAVAAGALVGLILGFEIGTKRTAAALKLARYRDSIDLVDDLVKTPDALDLRVRAQEILAAHRADNSGKES